MRVGQETVVAVRDNASQKRLRREAQWESPERESETGPLAAMMDWWRVFKRKTPAVVSLFILVFLTLVAAIGPLLPFYAPNDMDLANPLQPPSRTHVAGTDELGRDILSRAIFGARISLSVGFMAMAVCTVLGTIYGAIAGYYGGHLDNLMMRTIDVVRCFPMVFLLILLAAVYGPSFWNIVLANGLIGWTWTARLVRGEFLSLRERVFVEAARISGASNLRIVFRHLIPNVVPIIIVNTTLGVAQVILLESAVSFMGVGVVAPQTSWGRMLTSAQTYLVAAPWMSILPGVLIFVTVMSFNLVGDGLRDALDPRMRRLGKG